MAITRSSDHKRRATGGRRHPHHKKRKYAAGRPPAATKMGEKRIHLVRGRGGNTKFRALRLEEGNFSWGGETVTRKTRIVGVVYNASNNELVRTNTLVKGAVIEIDATPFKEWYEKHYRVAVPKKGDDIKTATTLPTKNDKGEEVKESRSLAAKLKARRADRVVDPKILAQFQSGRVLAKIESRPGQSGRADGIILEGPELEFYQRKIALRKGKAAA